MRDPRFSLLTTAVLVATCFLLTSPVSAQAQMQVYGAWHCYSDACSWASVPHMTTFGTDNHWLIDRDMDGSYHPSVNVVVLSFADPVKLMNLANRTFPPNTCQLGVGGAATNFNIPIPMPALRQQ